MPPAPARRRSRSRALLLASALAAVVGSAGAASAQSIGTAFTYQAELRSSGLPITTPTDLQFRLFDAPTFGTQVGTTLSISGVTPAAGRVTIDLDFGAGAFAGNARYLEIAIRNPAGAGSFATLLPRQPVHPAPYAMFAPTAGAAANSTQLNGQNASFYQNASNLTSGTIPDSQLAGSYTGAVSFNNTGNAFAGNGALLTALNASNLTTGTITDALLSPNVPRLSTPNTFTGANSFTGHVGVGVPSSSALLDVEGGDPGSYVLFMRGSHSSRIFMEGGTADNETAGGAVTINGGRSGFTTGTTGLVGGATTIAGGIGGNVSTTGSGTAGAGGNVILKGGTGGNGGDSGGRGGNVAIMPGDGGISGSTQAFPGFIGIGTTTPNRFLHIFEGPAGVGSPFSSTVSIESDSSAVLGFLAPPTLPSGLRFADDHGADATLLFNTSSAPRGFQIGTQGSVPKLTLTMDGKLGLGTTAPQGAVHVQGAGALADIILAPTTANGNSQIYFGENASVTGGFIVRNNGTTNLFEIDGVNSSTETTPRLTVSRSTTGGVTIANNLSVGGTLSKGAGSFKIDHPLDPEHKYLYHSFVESPDMMNIYNGDVVTDGNGRACIELPEWFEALNRDFRYQLTVVDPSLFALVRVTQKVQDHHFCIASNVPNIEVSWQVTGIRQDAFANANRIPVEQDKPAEAIGTYLHPDAWGQPPSRGENYPRHAGSIVSQEAKE